MRIAGTFNGTGSALYFCIGFVPDFITAWNLEGTQILSVTWNKHMMRASQVSEGLHLSGTSSTVTDMTKGEGVTPYYGGDILSSSDVGTTTYGSTSAVYLTPFNYDCRFNSSDSSHSYYDASQSSIDTWTLDSSSNFTGNFGSVGAVTGTYIGVGSPIQIDGRTYTITAFTADGGDTNDVTLSHNVASGNIEYIGGMYSTRPLTTGEQSKDGFILNDLNICVSGEMGCYEAGQYDK